ncbi:MAG TPA: TIGR00730 family Rossman fold protein [Thermomicrobiales bacterium]|nr:TIGR00730 family Rossman fold protein [Thermomicrobiales bacterium]
MKSVCVFCASNVGNDPAFIDVTKRLGAAIAERGIRLVYGGGHVGLMGVIADTVLAGGGEVVGVMPRSLVEREIAHTGLTELHISDSMHDRKATMERLSEGFIALPGGFGTLDEFCEIVTWAQLGYHAKPIGMLDANGYFDALRSFFDHTVDAGFVRPAHRSLILDAGTPEELLDLMATWQPTYAVKWT